MKKHSKNNSQNIINSSKDSPVNEGKDLPFKYCLFNGPYKASRDVPKKSVDFWRRRGFSCLNNLFRGDKELFTLIGRSEGLSNSLWACNLTLRGESPHKFREAMEIHLGSVREAWVASEGSSIKDKWGSPTFAFLIYMDKAHSYKLYTINS